MCFFLIFELVIDRLSKYIIPIFLAGVSIPKLKQHSSFWLIQRAAFTETVSQCIDRLNLTIQPLTYQCILRSTLSICWEKGINSTGCNHKSPPQQSCQETETSRNRLSSLKCTPLNRLGSTFIKRSPTTYLSWSWALCIQSIWNAIDNLRSSQ